MGVWGWILLYVVLFSLLQLLIYRYLRSDRDAPLFRSTPPTGDPTLAEERPEFEDPTRNDDPSVAVCPKCGAENDPGYTYCRDCVSPLAGY